MDELGFLTDPERRLGYLDAQNATSAARYTEDPTYSDADTTDPSNGTPGRKPAV